LKVVAARVRDSISVLCTAGLGLMLGLGAATAGSATADDLEEIVVTGSHIRGVEAAGSKLIVIDRDQIDASGYGSVAGVMSTVTQNFNRANPANSYPDFFNLSHGSEIQLRGLGGGTTLTLVNGQRQAASGWQGSFTDVSSIPLSAIERIEILPEGSSAMYGSDAIGGVVNIILRRDFEGVEARVRGSTTDSQASDWSAALLMGHSGARGNVVAGFQYDESDALQCSARAYCAANGNFGRFGGTDLRGYAGNPGTILDPVTLAPFAAIPHDQDGTQVTQAQLIPGTANYTDNVTNNDILPRQTTRSAFVSATYKLTEQWEIAADGRYSSQDFNFTYPMRADNFQVPTSNAFNHLGQPVLVAYDFSRDFGPVVDHGPSSTTFVSAALKGALPKGWQVDLAGAWSRASNEFFESNFYLNYDAVNSALASSDPATALNIFGDGSHTNPATLAALRAQNLTSDDLNIFTSTSANVIANGPLYSWRAGAILLAFGGELRREHSNGTTALEIPVTRDRSDNAGFLELAVPLLGPQGTTMDRLDLSLAGRYDSYSDAGSTFNPKVGIAWRPSALVKLRANWGTSFLAPPFFWSNPEQVGDSEIREIVDPRSPTGYTLALLRYGPDPNLKPETAHSWNAGVDLTPPSIPNFSLALTYFDIDYEGKIQQPQPDATLFLTQEAALASLITRDPTPAQIAAACTKPPHNGGSCDQPVAVIIDGRFRNLASIKTRGVDVALDYLLNTARGKLSSSLNGTYTIDQRQQVTPTAPVSDLVDTVGNPTSLRLVGMLSWSLRGWMVQGTVNYTGAYRDVTYAPARRVDSWTTLDINVGYRVDGGSGWLANTQVNLGIGYDPANASILGRQLSLQAVKRWGH
jgi:iron complex outermembrane receptor protein